MFDSQRNNLAAVCSGTLLVFAELSVLKYALVIGDGSGCSEIAAQSGVSLFGTVTLNFKRKKQTLCQRLQTLSNKRSKHLFPDELS